MQTLSAEDIGKSYRGRRVVNDVNLHVNQGEVVGLLGPNGAGKTTSFYIIVGLIPSDTGRVVINDQDITEVPMYLRARNFGISYLPQEPSIFRKLTVEDNILAVLEAQPISWHERRERQERLIDQLSLGVIRYRPDRRARIAEDHLRPENQRHRSVGDRSHRARDALGHRSCLHHQ